MEDDWFGEESEFETSRWVGWFEAANNRRTLRRIGQYARPPARLLDIGVGTGSFLAAARRAGYEVMGCDLSNTLAHRVISRHGVPVHCGPISQLEGDLRFEVVVMNHVLEHVQDPKEFLSDVGRVLVPGGIAHVAVPNVTCWEASLPGWTSYEPYHLMYFTPRTLTDAIARCGLEASAVVTHESFSGWTLALIRTLLGVNRGGRIARAPIKGSHGGAGRRRAWVEHAYRLTLVWVGVISWPLRLLQSRLGRGDEAICIARKSG